MRDRLRTGRNRSCKVLAISAIKQPCAYEIARHIGDPRAVENLRASAARHLVKADDVEKRSGGAPFHQSRSGGTIKSL
jgi:hypothetical protein